MRKIPAFCRLLRRAERCTTPWWLCLAALLFQPGAAWAGLTLGDPTVTPNVAPMTASPSATAAANSQITITLTVTHDRSKDDNTTLSIGLPTGWTCVSVAVAGNGSITAAPACNNTTVSWNAGSQAGSKTLSLSVTAQSPASVTNGNTVSFSGSVSSSQQTTPLTTSILITYRQLLIISGKVFEDINYAGGAGRDYATANLLPSSLSPVVPITVSGARVELYNSGGTFQSATTTSASGVYTFTGLPGSTTYIVRVVSGSVLATRTGANATLVGVQTYRLGTNGTNEVGGPSPSKADAGNGTTTLGALATATTAVQSQTTVALGNADVSNADFGYSFNTVTNTNDSGQGSLRQVITNMNALAATNLSLSFSAPFEPTAITATNVSIFMIPDGSGKAGMPTGVDLFGAAQTDGTKVATINLASALPNLTTAGTYLDATTHPSWSTRPIIELNGTSAGAATVGVTNIGTLRGFILNRFTSHGSAAASGCTACVWEGNWIGVDNTGTAKSANGGSGISLTTGTGHKVGASTSANAKYRNVISGNTGSGITASVSATIQGNYIGTNAAGAAGLGNTLDGITVSGGSPAIIANGTLVNVISGNAQWGVKLTTTSPASPAAITGAIIGRSADNSSAIANTSGGINVVSLSSTTALPITGNTIGSNGGPGILVNANNTNIGDGTAAGSNSIFSNTGAGISVLAGISKITRNSIYSNTGRGIDLGGDGITANNGTTAAGPNNGMDFPVFQSATLNAGNLTVSGYVGSAAGQTTAAFKSATVEIFRSDITAPATGGNYQGKTYLGAVTTSSSNGNFTNLTIPVSGLGVGDAIVATARDGSGNTSEFGSAIFSITGPWANHLSISSSGTGVTCTPTAVTVTAHNSDHSVYTSYTGTLTLTTSTAHGDWALVTGSGTLTNSGNGSATYAFSISDAGTATFNFSNTFAETVNINVTDGVASDTSGTVTAATEDASIAFATTGFQFQAGGVANAIGNQIAGKSSAVAPGAQTLTLRAIKTSDSTSACVPALQGSKTVQFAYECISPATCSAATMSLSGDSTVNIAGNASGSVSGYTNASVTFDNAGTAPFSVNWNDAGSTKLYARYSLPLASGSASGNFMSGSSNTFVSRPLGFDLTISGNPAATSNTGSQFTSAGTTFNGTARAVVWSAAADANGDGIADGMESTDTNAGNNVSLSGNATTPNFAPSTSLTLSSNLISPSPGTHPGLAGSPTATFTNGVASITGLRYDEVGIIEISAAQSGSYLSLSTTETAKIRGASGYVGRFVPKRFTVTANTPTFANTCNAGSFTYEGQPFYYGTAPVLSVTAVSAQGGATQNYTRSGYFKLVSTLSGRSFANAAAGTHPITVANTGSPTIAGDTGGTGTATFTLPNSTSGDAFTYTKGAPGAPFTSSVNASFTVADLTDSDSVCYDATNDGTCDTFSISGITGTNLRYGQLVIENAMGPETAALAVPLYTQYYNGSGWLVNTADSCSTLTTAALDFGAVTPAGAPAAGVMSFSIGSGTSTASLTRATASSGLLGLSLSAPGSGNTGEITYLVNLSTAAATWLQGDWNNDGTRADNPSGRATFGIFQGPKKVIFRREVW